MRSIAGGVVAAILLTAAFIAPAQAKTVEALARPANGTILYDRISGGHGVLKVKNGTKRDAVVTLMKGSKKAISVYVRAKSTAKVDTVVDGTYRVYFTTGTRFSVSKGRFGRNPSYQRFDDKLRFVTTATSYSIWTLTLQPVIGGNAKTSGVNPKDFPA
ncbi:hypothetical protein [Thermoactinospora rubra]|uniref:hypothetical protein n=1 Tax=Thermoactinospora rubra TaxID=1088767 RepID=UPI00117CB694|nr:hypothetical protein [Thermoactinospora rubra]